jgi:membrane-associated phospholipid phosphatase
MTIEFIIRLMADLAVIPIVLIAAYALIFKIPKGKRYQAYCRILLAGLTAYLLAKFIGTIYQPSTERPFEVLGVDPGASYLDNPGFPSDHALFVAAITFAVWFETRQKALTIILVVLTILVCLGRVIALVHTPLDVIGGVAIAALGAVWYIQKPVEKRGRRGKSNR